MIASIKGYVEILKELLQADINTDQQAKVRDVCIPQHQVPNRYHSYLIHSIIDSLAMAMLYSRMVYLVNCILVHCTALGSIIIFIGWTYSTHTG